MNSLFSLADLKRKGVDLMSARRNRDGNYVCRHRERDEHILYLYKEVSGYQRQRKKRCVLYRQYYFIHEKVAKCPLKSTREKQEMTLDSLNCCCTSPPSLRGRITSNQREMKVQFLYALC